MTIKTKTQKSQDDEYSYPYHYIPEFRNNFSPLIFWKWSLQYISAIEYVLNQIKKDEEHIRSIADVGCGDGRLTKELMLEFPQKKIVGIDYSERAILLARALNPTAEFLNIDITNCDIESKYDAITLIEVFEHIPIEQCEKFVDVLSDILNEKGKIYLTVPHKNKPISYKHFQHFTLSDLKNHFKKNFIIKEVEYIQKGSKLLLLINLITNNRFYISTNNVI
jgi:2-polyprenyl-3-methyl-5-hydroxy-6-metoxy-1,4-benzoquinol methylase